MPYQLFHDLFPDIAERETRSLTVLPGANIGLPPGEYGFLEMFCNDAGCDCRRVFFYVLSSSHREPMAIIAWGWEGKEFYRNWMGGDDWMDIAEVKGPTLNLGSPQSNLALALLDFVRNSLIRDPAYVERVKRHYAMFRNKIDGKPIRSGRHAKKQQRSRKR